MRTLIKFEAEWCGPCHAIRPVVEKIVKQHELNYDVIDIDNLPAIAEDYGVQSIPALILIDENSQEIARHVGSAPQSVIEKNLGL